MNKIYFDNAATTQIDTSVIELMNGVMSNHYGNPNSTHSFGRSSRTLIEKARKSISKEFNVLPAEIFFTSCGTESDNLVLISAVRDLGVKRIITSKIEHKAVLNVVKFLELNDRINVEYVKVKVNGLIDYDDLDLFFLIHPRLLRLKEKCDQELYLGNTMLHASNRNHELNLSF